MSGIYPTCEDTCEDTAENQLLWFVNADYPSSITLASSFCIAVDGNGADYLLNGHEYATVRRAITNIQPMQATADSVLEREPRETFRHRTLHGRCRETRL